MKQFLYLCQFLMITQMLNSASVFGQASIYSSKRGGRTIAVDFAPANGNANTVKVAMTAVITAAPDVVTIGPNSTDSASISVTSTVKWKVINTVGWIKTNPDAWISTDGDKKVIVKPNLQWLTPADITGVDLQGSFTIEEDSPSPTRIVKTISVTFKSIPGVLTIPEHNVTFNSVATKTYAITSNLPWSAEPKIPTGWLTVTPSFSPTVGTVNLVIGCKSINGGSKDNSVYLIIKQSKGIVKDSILVVQSGTSVGIGDYERSGIKIYPQPVKEILNIDLPSTPELKYWEIFSPIGIEIQKGVIGNTSKLQIPVGQLSPGVYFITLYSETKKYGFKFSK